jgi:ABC-type cobalamin/Fe3+-siderophores transport system ATPase subunit
MVKYNWQGRDRHKVQEENMVQRISIKGLFGYFDYEIPLWEERISILTGPNGFGKSTIINCINAFGNSNLEFFVDLNFKKIEIFSSDGSKVLCIKKMKDGLKINDEDFPESWIACFSRGMNLNNPYRTSGRMQDKEHQKKYQSYIRQMSQVFGNVTLIKEQRLIRHVRRSIVRSSGEERSIGSEIIETVKEVPYKLVKKMGEIGSEYSRVANELDSTYPERLFRQEEKIEESEFQEKLRLMRERVGKLNSYGISDIQELKIKQFRPEDARALKVYFDDFEKKYDNYTDLVERLELFVEIINKRFLFKRVEISSNEGLIIRDKHTEKEIDLLKLSSGEKETIVLFYNLLFEISSGEILLIDEPEISLHIAWQRMFINDLKKIAELRNLTILVATHSPQMISGNRNIQIDLGELYKNGLSERKQDKG